MTLNLGLDGQVPQGAVYTNATRGTLNLRGDGGLDGQAPPNSGTTMPVVTNVEDQTVRTDLINNLLVDPGLQDNQLATLEQLVVDNGYPGLIVDYRGVDAVPSARADYVRFIDQIWPTGCMRPTRRWPCAWKRRRQFRPRSGTRVAMTGAAWVRWSTN